MLLLMPQRRDLTEIRPEDRRAAPASQRVGVLISQAYDGGPEQHIDLCQCIHCEALFPFVRGSGVTRGWCMGCNGMTCGRPCCDPCVNRRQMIENMERGLPWAEAKKYKPVTGRVEAEPPRSTGGVILGR